MLKRFSLTTQKINPMNYWILYWILIAFMMVGIIGIVVPLLPGTSLILGAILVWGIATKFTGIVGPMIVVISILILSMVIVYLATILGLQQFGASKWAQFGAIIGLVVGLFGLLPALPFGGPLLGVLIGPILGAFIGEFLYQRDVKLIERIKPAFKASIGVFIGSILGNVIELVLGIVAVGIFVIKTWPLVSTLQP